MVAFDRVVVVEIEADGFQICFGGIGKINCLGLVM